jgi:hypothetical protein
MTSVAEKLAAARRQQFVGRTDERSLFREALTAVTPPFVLFNIFGPGGVGKTSLLRELVYIAEHLQAKVIRLDGRNIDPTPDFFLGTLQQLLNVKKRSEIFSTIAAINGRVALFIDTAELLTPLDGWLRDIFLPQLPDNVLVVLAGRNPPSLRWRTDPGWQSLMHVVSLRNLSPEESRAFLVRRQIPAVEHDAILNFTHGHPLALSLGADIMTQHPENPFQPENSPNIIKTLLEQFIQDAPTSLHRAALEACSRVRLLNEPLLGEMLQTADPHPLFDWLRSLSFIDVERRGLFPHDLAREALGTDLRWRNPDWHATLHERARQYYMARFQDGDERDQRRTLSDYIYLHRENPVIRPYFEWQSTGSVFTDHYKPTDKTLLLQTVQQYEGIDAAHIAAHWLDHAATKCTVFREVDGTTQGLLLRLSLEKTAKVDRALDPGTEAVWRFLEERAPLRPGETATFFRFWMARESYQSVSSVQSRIFLNMVQHYLTTPGLAYTFIPTADPEFWTAMFTFADLHRLPNADFTVGNSLYGVYGHDWRAMPPITWLNLMGERELSAIPTTAETPQIPLLVLSESKFAAAVKDALRDYTNPIALQTNPLLQSRIVVDNLDGTIGERVEKLQELLRETAASLKRTPRYNKWFRVVHHTFFQPAPTQEKAAELLDLPFSTYRRHLRSGIAAITEQLWQKELGKEIKG